MIKVKVEVPYSEVVDKWVHFYFPCNKPTCQSMLENRELFIDHMFRVHRHPKFSAIMEANKSGKELLERYDAHLKELEDKVVNYFEVIEYKVCEECSAVFKYEESLIKHKKMEEFVRSPPQPENERIRKLHRTEIHLIPLKCPECETPLKDYKLFKSHMMETHSYDQEATDQLFRDLKRDQDSVKVIIPFKVGEMKLKRSQLLNLKKSSSTNEESEVPVSLDSSEDETVIDTRLINTKSKPFLDTPFSCQIPNCTISTHFRTASLYSNHLEIYHALPLEEADKMSKSTEWALIALGFCPPPPPISSEVVVFIQGDSKRKREFEEERVGEPIRLCEPGDEGAGADNSGSESDTPPVLERQDEVGPKIVPLDFIRETEETDINIEQISTVSTTTLLTKEPKTYQNKNSKLKRDSLCSNGNNSLPYFVNPLDFLEEFEKSEKNPPIIDAGRDPLHLDELTSSAETPSNKKLKTTDVYEEKLKTLSATMTEPGRNALIKILHDSSTVCSSLSSRDRRSMTEILEKVFTQASKEENGTKVRLQNSSLSTALTILKETSKRKTGFVNIIL